MASIIILLGLAPAHAASITTEDFVAIVQPTATFLDESSRLAPGRTDSTRILAFAHAETREQTDVVASLAAWRQSQQVAEARDAAAPTIDGLGPTFNALAVPLGTLADTTHLLPTPPFTRLPSADRANAVARDEVARLATLRDAAFDARYSETQAQGLRRLIALYKDFILNGDDEALRRLAVHELPRAERRLAAIAGARLVIVIGLTGSVGMGKSTTAAMFAKAGVPVFDADAAVHRLYTTRAVAPVEAAFPGVTRDGRIDRETLGRHVIGDAAAMRRLEAIVHPLVREEREAFLEQARADGAAMAVLDIPLLLETGGESEVDVVVIASAPKPVQKARVLARPGMSEARFEAILAKQMPDEEKRRRARFVIETGDGLEAAERQVREVIATLRG